MSAFVNKHGDEFLVEIEASPGTRREWNLLLRSARDAGLQVTDMDDRGDEVRVHGFMTRAAIEALAKRWARTSLCDFAEQLTESLHDQDALSCSTH